MYENKKGTDCPYKESCENMKKKKVPTAKRVV